MFSDASPSKQRIYIVAAKMFAEQGFKSVFIRHLAKEVGMTGSSIYNHFKTKKEILDGLFYIYTEQHKSVIPDVNHLLDLSEYAPVRDILTLLDYHFPEEIEPFMHNILAAGIQSIPHDDDSKKFVRENLLDLPKKLLVPVLEKLVDLGRIEQIDVSEFAYLVTHHCFCVAAINAVWFEISREAWKKRIEYLFSLAIKPTGK